MIKFYIGMAGFFIVLFLTGWLVVIRVRENLLKMNLHRTIETKEQIAHYDTQQMHIMIVIMAACAIAIVAFLL